MKHRWVKKPNGKIDDFAWGSGFCNGPVCAECGEMPCEHCNPEYDSEECEGREGFKVYTSKIKLLGIYWSNKTLTIGIWFVTINFSFDGLFPYCEEIKDD